MKGRTELKTDRFKKDLKAALENLSVLELSQYLLGKVLITEVPAVDTKSSVIRTGGIISEVEAYSGTNDEASHSARGETQRNKAMFQTAGTVYVYLIYGFHYCVNISAERSGIGAAVLIRALVPTTGIPEMRIRRGGGGSGFSLVKLNKHLCGGPGKVCQALGINMNFNGQHIFHPAPAGQKIYLEAGISVGASDIMTSPRIGISKALELHWRSYLDPFKVSL